MVASKLQLGCCVGGLATAGLWACAPPPAPASTDPAVVQSPASTPTVAAPATALSGEAGPTGTSAARTHFDGHLGGSEFAVASALFLWRPQADDMQLVFADVDDLCGALGASAWPREARLLSITLKLNGPDESSFCAGAYPVRADGPPAARDTKRASYLELDASCQPRVQSRARAGVVRLAGEPVGPEGTRRGELDLTFDEGTLTGHFEAAYCPTPELEPSGCR